jgi:hypothetical protein
MTDVGRPGDHGDEADVSILAMLPPPSASRVSSRNRVFSDRSSPGFGGHLDSGGTILK